MQGDINQPVRARQRKSSSASTNRTLQDRGYRITPLSSSSMVGRAVDGRTHQTLKKRPTYPKATPATKKSAPTQAKQAQAVVRAAQPKQPQKTQVKPSKITTPSAPESKPAKKQSSKRSKHKDKLIFAMAGSVFVFGMGMALYGYLQTNQLKQQLAELTQSSGGGGEVAGAVVNAPHADLPDETQVSENLVRSHQVGPEEPRYISIEKADVDMSRVLKLDQTPEGAVDTPTGIWDSGWYQRSASPTDNGGAMLIVGHYSGPTQLGIFGKLGGLSNGDVIEIEQGDGTKSQFKVVEMETFNIENVDMRKALAPADPTVLGLNIMTCGGSFDTGTNQFDERLLVRTVKI